MRDNRERFGIADPDPSTRVIQTRTGERVDVTVNPNTERRLKDVVVYKNGTRSVSGDTTCNTAETSHRRAVGFGNSESTNDSSLGPLRKRRASNSHATKSPSSLEHSGD